MIGVAFGVSYFPIGWRAAGDGFAGSESDGEDVYGPFPLPGKQALGIRMFLFSTVVGQVAFVWTSKFKNPIGLQMVENVPFCHSLALIVTKHQGFGIDALSTLMCLFGFSSVLVGAVFYLLGRLELGRVVYFFPTHVLVGCIGGIGIFLAKTGVEVTTDDHFVSFRSHLDLVGQAVGFEIVLRLLKWATRDPQGTPRYPLMAPIYFCMITPVFYVLLWIVQISPSDVPDFFFPSITDSSSSSDKPSLFDPSLFDIWNVIHPPTVTWGVVWDSIPTMISLTLFSLIHVPINIPAFAVSTNVEADMNNVLMAHGYSNFLVGLLGGLQNYMAYTQSILYDRSGGTGKVSGMVVAFVTCILFLIGPTMASYVPRCMAGTLLLHVGIDLFLEGSVDSYPKFDRLEYCGIWLIIVVMTLYGMEAAMIAGVIAAVSTYSVQSITYPVPIRGFMCAATLRSSNYSRNNQAMALLDSPQNGRHRIFIVQLQGHLFFGNMAQFGEKIINELSRMYNTSDEAWIVILDFSLVLGIDSSAAQAVVKLKDKMERLFAISPSVFVTGSQEGFPCDFPLSEELTHACVPETFAGGHVFNSLDEGLVYAEDALVFRHSPNCLKELPLRSMSSSDSGTSGELDTVELILQNLTPIQVPRRDISILAALFTREQYSKDEMVWRQGADSDSAKLVVKGMLISLLLNEAGTSETISSGNMIGELGLVHGVARMSSVQCHSSDAVVYSISRERFDRLAQSEPRIARMVDLICIRYLTNRVQHVSNRIFETRCLPI